MAQLGIIEAVPMKPMTNTCQRCGQVFTSRTSRIFCGNQCYHSARKVLTERVCKACGVTFYKKNQGHHGSPIYCGMTCQTIGRTMLVDLACERCGTTFRRKPAHVSRSRFCSRACHYSAKTDLRSITCLKCKRVFSVRKGR